MAFTPKIVNSHGLRCAQAPEVEDAFQTIRAATGMTDIHSIVEKFLTREKTYSQLLVNVAE